MQQRSPLKERQESLRAQRWQLQPRVHRLFQQLLQRQGPRLLGVGKWRQCVLL